MITLKGKLIEINNSLEWILFERIIQKASPIKLLKTTDSIIQLPNFLFALTLVLVCFTDFEGWIKLILPPSTYFVGQLMVNSKLRLSNIILLPASVYESASNVFMFAAFITSFFYLKWWICLLFIPIYFIGIILSLIILTSREKKFYKENYAVQTGNFEIFKNNAYLSAYKHTAKKLNITTDLNPADEEIINNFSDKKHFKYMRKNWDGLKDNFNDKAQQLWMAYLFPEN